MKATPALRRAKECRHSFEGAYQSRRSKALVHDAPEGCDRFLVGLKEILEKAVAIQRWGISVALAIFTKFGGPIHRLARINDLEEPRRIQIGTPFVVKDTKRISLNPDHHILLTRREVGIASVSPTKLDDHLSVNLFASDLNAPNTRMFIPVVFVAVPPPVEGQATFFDPL